MDTLRTNKTLIGSIVGVSLVTGVSLLGYLAYEKYSGKGKKNGNIVSPRTEERSKLVDKETILRVVADIGERVKSEIAKIQTRCRKKRRTFSLTSDEYAECVHRYQQWPK